jgi:hypothetical protein
MKTKKSATETPEQGVTLEPKHHAAPARQTGPVAVATTSVSQTLSPVTDGVIDLDPETKTEFHVQEHVGETVVLQPGQKAKRKYTKRAKKATTVTVTPTFVNLDGVRAARIQAFTAYVDGKDEFEHAIALDDQLKKLEEIGKEIAARQIKA